jgi:hypothetical protein
MCRCTVLHWHAEPSGMPSTWQSCTTYMLSTCVLCRGPDWHVLPVVPRVALHDGPHGIPLTHLEDILLPMAKVNKFAPPSYAAQLLARQNPGLQGELVNATSSAKAQSSTIHSWHLSILSSLLCPTCRWQPWCITHLLTLWIGGGRYGQP